MQPRLGVSYQARKGKGDKIYADWGRYFNMDQKSSGRSLAPNRIFQTQTIFDLNGTAPDSGPFVATNLPCAAFAACVGADAERTYRAFTVDVRRQLTDGWQTSVSYTWSRFEGNYDLDYGTTGVFNTSSFIQDGPGTNVQDQNRFGPLFEDRPHVFKILTSHALPSGLMGSAYFRVQSGTSPQPDVGQPRSHGVVPVAHARPHQHHARGARAERDRQSDAAVDRLAAVPRPADLAHAAVLQPHLQPNPFFGTGNCSPRPAASTSPPWSASRSHLGVTRRRSVD